VNRKSGPARAADNREKSLCHLKLKETTMATTSTRKKSTARKPAAKKTSAPRKTARKYSPGAAKDVETEMRAMKEGKLKSGRSGKKVTNPKQAIAIGLSKARKEGKRVPAKKS
jgi:hypothetical protein